MDDLPNESQIDSDDMNIIEKNEAGGRDRPMDRLSLSSVHYKQKRAPGFLLELCFAIPAAFTTWLAYECTVSISLLNRFAWFYGFGIHAATMAILWYFAIKLAAIEHDDVSRRRMLVTGVLLGLLYVFSSVLSWIMVMLSVLPV